MKILVLGTAVVAAVAEMVLAAAVVVAVDVAVGALPVSMHA